MIVLGVGVGALAEEGAAEGLPRPVRHHAPATRQHLGPLDVQQNPLARVPVQVELCCAELTTLLNVYTQSQMKNAMLWRFQGAWASVTSEA